MQAQTPKSIEDIINEFSVRNVNTNKGMDDGVTLDWLRSVLKSYGAWLIEAADNNVDRGCMGGCGGCLGGDESYLEGIEAMKDSIKALNENENV